MNNEFITDKKGFLTEYTGKAAEVFFPKNIKTVAIGYFDGSTFDGTTGILGKSIRRVTFEKGMKKIPENALLGDTALTEAVIPSGVKSIGSRAFGNCSSLKTVILPEGIEKIGTAAFSECTSLENIVFPESLKVIEESAFYGCANLKTIIFNNGLKEIGQRCFYKCPLTEVIIPESLQKIGCEAFTCDPASIDYTDNERISIRSGSLIIKNADGSITSVLPSRNLCIKTAAGSKRDNECVYIAQNKLSETILRLPQSDRERYELSAHDSNEAAQIAVYMSGVSRNETVGWSSTAFNPHEIIEAIMNILQHETGAEVYCYESNASGFVLRNQKNFSIADLRKFYDFMLNRKSDAVKMFTENSAFQNLLEIPEAVINHIFTGKVTYHLTDSNTNAVNTSDIAERGRWFIDIEKLSADGLAKPDLVRRSLQIDMGNLTAFNASKLALYMEGKRKNNLLVQEIQHQRISFSDVIANIVNTLSACEQNDLLSQYKKDASEFIGAAGSNANSEDLEKFHRFLSGEISPADRKVEDNKNSGNNQSSADEDHLEASVKLNWNKLNPDAVRRTDQLGLSPIHYRNGQLCSMQALVFVLASYSGQMKQSIAATADEYKTLNLGFDFSQDADRIQAEMNQEEFSDLLDRFEIQYGELTFRSDGKRFKKCHGSFLISYARYGNEKQIARLIAEVNKQGFSGRGGRGFLMLIRNALLLSDTKAALLQISKNANEYDLKYYAKIRNTDIDTIIDHKLIDFGLDEDGKKILDLGSRQVEACISDDLKVNLYDPATKKELKSIPKKGTDPVLYGEAKEDISEMRKNIKRVISDRKHILLRSFLNETVWKADQWKSSYVDNPVLRNIAKCIVWAQGTDTFTIKNKSFITFDETPYQLNQSAVEVAHPLAMTSYDIKAWQKYFTSCNLAQPFPQIWECVHHIEDIKPDRYAGMEIPSYRVKNADEHGIHFHDEDFHDKRYFTTDDMSIDNHCIHEIRHVIPEDERATLGNVTISKITRKNNHILYLLDMWTLKERIRKNEDINESILNSFTLQQIMELIDEANACKAANSIVVLMNYKNKNFKDYDPMDQFILDY